MTFATELESKLHAALTEAREDIDRLIKQFQSAVVVSDEHLQTVHDKIAGALDGGAAAEPVVANTNPPAPAGDAAIERASTGATSEAAA